MAEKAGADTSAPTDPFSGPMERIRESGKWLIAAVAAVGAAMIAGSQLSSLGSLSLCVPDWSWHLGCLRLPLAIAGSALALAAVVWALWSAVALLLPVGVSLDDLVRQWELDHERGKLKPEARADVAFFSANRGSIPGTGDDATHTVPKANAEFDEAKKAVRAAETALLVAQVGNKRATIAAATSDLADKQTQAASWRSAVRTMLHTAQYQLLQARFRRLLHHHLLPATVLAAVGITTFAWASNPATSSADLGQAKLVGADLRAAKLAQADLQGADLTNANLEGADMSGANLIDVIWRNTTCPDGTNSDAAHPTAPTCRGHLSG